MAFSTELNCFEKPMFIFEDSIMLTFSRLTMSPLATYLVEKLI